MADPMRVARRLGDLADMVKNKAEQVESNQATCKILAGHISAVIPEIKKLEDNICEVDETLQDFIQDMGSLLVETDKLIDKIRSRNMATKLLKASSDERELTAIEKRLAQMSQRATLQILTIVTEIKTMISGEGTLRKNKDFCPFELKLLSRQNVDRGKSSYVVTMRTTGGIIFVCNMEHEDFWNFFTLEQGGSLDKERVEFTCEHRYNVCFLFIQIVWREYLVISCWKCRDIKLVELETMEITTAFSDEQLVGQMCKGWHKIYVEVESGYLELDCSSTKFTKIRHIETKRGGNTRFRDLGRDCFHDLCYVPSPHNLIVAFGWNDESKKNIFHVTSVDEPTETLWDLSDKKVNGIITSVVYSSRHNALLAVHSTNKTIWVINPSNGMLQNIDVPEIGFPAKGFLHGSQLVIVSYPSGMKEIPAGFRFRFGSTRYSVRNCKIEYFSFS